jgi:hypothetical protein
MTPKRWASSIPSARELNLGRRAKRHIMPDTSAQTEIGRSRARKMTAGLMMNLR